MIACMHCMHYDASLVHLLSWLNQMRYWVFKNSNEVARIGYTTPFVQCKSIGTNQLKACSPAFLRTLSVAPCLSDLNPAMQVVMKERLKREDVDGYFRLLSISSRLGMFSSMGVSVTPPPSLLLLSPPFSLTSCADGPSYLHERS